MRDLDFAGRTPSAWRRSPSAVRVCSLEPAGAEHDQCIALRQHRPHVPAERALAREVPEYGDRTLRRMNEDGPRYEPRLFARQRASSGHEQLTRIRRLDRLVCIAGRGVTPAGSLAERSHGTARASWQNEPNGLLTARGTRRNEPERSFGLWDPARPTMDPTAIWPSEPQQGPADSLAERNQHASLERSRCAAKPVRNQLGYAWATASRPLLPYPGAYRAFLTKQS